jgi:Flp pilus assembly protein TadG
MEKEIKRNRRGVVIWYSIVLMTAMCMFASLAVDWGHAQMVKTELRRTADASARAAAALIPTNLTSATAAAVDIASKNTADGMSVTLVPAQDIQYGFWNVNLHTFTPTASGINAVHVTARKSNARGTAVPMLFGKALGLNNMNVQGEAICMVIAPINLNQDVPATANPFLAGMPAGSEASNINPHNNPDYAGTTSNPKESPIAVNLSVSQGDNFNFDSVTGQAKHDPGDADYGPDGNPSSDQWGHNILNKNPNQSSYQDPTTLNSYSQNGIANMNAPINALVGVFLDDKEPDLSPTPQALDFSTAAQQNYNTIGSVDTGGTVQDQPLKLKQIFFIGDNMNSKGQRQTIIAPKGATRLYLATWDFYEWNNNSGDRTIKVTKPGRVILVK